MSGITKCSDNEALAARNDKSILINIDDES